MMKAIRVNEFGAPEVLRYEDAVVMPEAGTGEVVVQVAAAGVNPVETYVRSGMYPRLPSLPYTPGSDGAGIVYQVGEGVDNFKAGERVFTSRSISGTYAEFALCNAASVHRLPDNITDSQGAALGVPYGTAWCALFLHAEVKAQETVLIHGATGGVGIAAVQMAHAYGLKVIATGGTQKGRALAFAQGADAVLDHTKIDYLNQVPELTDGRGVDVVIEMAAHINLGKDLTILAQRHGRVVVVGSRGETRLDARNLMSRDARIIGMSLMNQTPEQLAPAYSEISKGLESKELNPVIGTELHLADAAQAHRQIMETGAYGKIVLLP